MDTQMTWSLQDLLYQASSTVSIILATCRGVTPQFLETLATRSSARIYTILWMCVSLIYLCTYPLVFA